MMAMATRQGHFDVLRALCEDPQLERITSRRLVDLLVLATLAQRAQGGGSLATFRELAETFHMQSATMSRLLDRLEDVGAVTRIHGGRGARNRIYIRLTDDGEAINARVAACFSEARRRPAEAAA